MRVLALCCTYNRFNCLRRSIKCFLDQDYEGEHTLLIYNSGEPLTLEIPSLPPNKRIHIINNSIDRYTNAPYTEVGSKYRDALHAAPTCDLVVSWDDDDIPLPNHISEGVNGIVRARQDNPTCLAYKPFYSYYRHAGGLDKCHNVFEPSIFVDYNYLMDAGYAPVTVKYHQQWLDPLSKSGNIFVDKQGPSTWIYDWHPELKVYKMSGRADTKDNFIAHQVHSQDTGDGQVLTPLPNNETYYNLVYGL